MKIRALVMPLALCVHLHGTALAQSDTAGAEALYQDGRKLLDEGKVSAACPKLAESYRLDPATGTLLALAHCHQQEGKLATAWAEYNEAATRARRENTEVRAQFAKERVDALTPRLSKLTIRVDGVTAALAGFELQRNGAPVGSGAVGAAIPIDGGTYRIVARAPGYKAWEQSVVVRPESDLVAVTVPPLEAQPGAPGAAGPQQGAGAAGASGGPAPAPADRGFEWTGLRIGGAATAGAGVIALGVGGYFALRAKSKNTESNDAGCTETECPPGALELRDDALSAADAATIAGIAGLVLVGAGTTLFFIGGPSDSSAPQAAVSAVVGPGSVSVALTGSLF